MQRTVSRASTEERGVYWAPYTKQGLPVLYAVKSNGERLDPGLILMPDSSADDAIDYLWRQLDKQDPIRKLELVKSESRPPAPLDVHAAIDGTTWARMQHSPKMKHRVRKYMEYLESRRNDSRS